MATKVLRDAPRAWRCFGLEIRVEVTLGRIKMSGGGAKSMGKSGKIMKVEGGRVCVSSGVLCAGTCAGVYSLWLCTSASCSLTAIEPQHPVASLRKNCLHFFFVLRNLSLVFELNLFKVRALKRGEDVVVAQEADMQAEASIASETMMESCRAGLG